MTGIKKALKTDAVQKYQAFALIGQGGIGKTRLAQELSLVAQNEAYYTVAVQNVNDFHNSRNLILDMIMKLVNFENQVIISYENIHEKLRTKLGANFSIEWSLLLICVAIV